MEKSNSAAPAINILETDKEYKVELAAPGLTKDDFKIRVNDENQLVVTMEKKQEQSEEKKDGRYQMCIRDRTIAVGEGVTTLLRDMSPEEIFRNYARHIGIGGIAMAGVVGIIRSSKIIRQALGLSLIHICTGHPYHREVVEHLILTLFYEISAICHRGQPLRQKARRRQEELFEKFLYLVATHYRTQRSLNFYAEQMCLTPKYLSSIIKQASGESATEWIIHTVIRNAQALLENSQLTLSLIHI